MKLISLHIIFILVLGFQLNAQTNLVPNYSFEDKDSCGDGLRGIDKMCYNWFSPLSKMDTIFNPFVPKIGSSDYFNICNFPTTSTPQNIGGYQQVITGVAYSGFFLLGIGHPPNYPYHNTKEYIEVQLSSKLIRNRKYCVEFFYSLADNNYNYHPIAIEALITDTLVKRTPHQRFRKENRVL